MNVGVEKSLCWAPASANGVSIELSRCEASRHDEAMLAEIYGWFTEGFDTADLRDAKALLHELSAV